MLGEQGGAAAPAAATAATGQQERSSSRAGFSTTQNGDPHAWTGEPRVIYHDVLERVDSLRRARWHAASAAAAANGRANNRVGPDEEELRYVQVVLNPTGDMFDFLHDEVCLGRKGAAGGGLIFAPNGGVFGSYCFRISWCLADAK